jgi:hypothetical protein
VVGLHGPRLCGGGGAVLAEIAVETVGEELRSVGWIEGLDQVAAVRKRVDQLARRSRPDALAVEPVDCDEFRSRVAGVVEIDSEGRILELVLKVFSAPRGSGRQNDGEQGDSDSEKHMDLQGAHSLCPIPRA